MPSIKPKIKKKKKIIGEPREPETRDNYKKWPTTSLLFVGLACGAIFFVASNPTRIHQAKNEQLVLQMFFLGLSIMTFFPALLVLFVLSVYCIMKALEIRIPKSFFQKFPLLSRFHKEAQRQSGEDCFLERENQRREYIGDIMLELESDSSQDSYYSDDTEQDSTGSDIWTTHNHHQNDPNYQYQPENSDLSSLESVSVQEYPAVHQPNRKLPNTPRIVINRPSTTE